MSNSLVEHFSTLKDPRMVKKCDHKLIDILVIVVCATICRWDESWEQVADFAVERESWLRKFLELPAGIPSHDTLRRVFLLLDPNELQSCFLGWASCFRTKISGETIAIDGKTVRGSRDKSSNKRPIHVVSAWANENQLVLGQVKVDEKSNEITAIPELLNLLDIAGCTITIDAMGTQKKIVEVISDKNADYVLGLKSNQKALHDDVKTYIDDQLDIALTDDSHSEKKTADADHGRIEERSFHLFTDISWIEKKDSWKNFNAIGVVQARIERDGGVSTDRRYYITSLKDVDNFAKHVRGHWGVENSLHWTLDVAFNEDKCTRRKGNAPANSNVLKHMVLNLLKREKTKKIAINRKRAMAGWRNDYLEKIVFG